MKKITNAQWERVEHNPLNSMKKIGFYDAEKNSFVEVARWRNAYSQASGANYGLLQVWTVLFNSAFFESQGGRNTCGGYNKPIANLESCLYQLQEAIKKNEVVHEGDFEFSSCGSIDSLMRELMEYLQKMYSAKLFIIDIL